MFGNYFKGENGLMFHLNCKTRIMENDKYVLGLFEENEKKKDLGNQGRAYFHCFKR